MPPHAATLVDDTIEIELAGEELNVRYEQQPSPKSSPKSSPKISNAHEHTLQHQKSLMDDSEDEMDDIRLHIDTTTGALDRTSSIDSADQTTIYDQFTSLCAPVCGNTFPKKSAMRTRGSISTARSVSFNSLTVREYDLTLGDHPSSASGPPVQLNWQHKAENTMPLDDYEQMRQPRRKRRQLKMSFQEREQLLQESGFTMDELKNAWMNSLKVRQQRYETVMTGSLTTKMEEAWESTCRKFNRLFTLTSEQEGFEVQAESSDAPRQWSYYTSAENEETPGAWSLFECVGMTTRTNSTKSNSNSTLISV